MIRIFFVFILFFSSAKAEFPADFLSYLRNFKNLELEFIQENPDDTVDRGVVYFFSPKKIRLEYFSSLPVVLIFNGNVVTYHDKDLEETSHKILSKSHYAVKFADNFYDELSNKSIKTKGKISYTGKVEENSFTLIFNANPVFLDSLLVIGPDGSETRIKFLKIVYNKVFAKNLFTEF